VAAQSLLLFAGLSLACGWQTGGSLLLCGGLLAWLRPLDLSWTFAKPTAQQQRTAGLPATRQRQPGEQQQ
ncbi:MAG: hypothetical protein ACK5F7_07540, partial [Planctomycetaceae bacterium]